MVMKMRGAGAAAWAGAAGTVVSAVIYLFDFATNVSTLWSYYRYEYECPHAPPGSALLRDDPICNAIRSGFELHKFGLVFWSGLLLLVVAHLTYAIIFWFTLDPSEHPLRSAYFLPLIHLRRLFKVLLYSFNTNRLKELQKSQKEVNGLYNALGVALETAPQFALQLMIALNLGQYITGSSVLTEQAQKIPTFLILSLVASIISCIYGASMAGLYVMENRMPFLKRAFISIMLGIQVFSAMLAEGISVSSLFQVTEPRLPVPLAIFLTLQLIIAWLFSGLVIHVHYRDRQGKSMWLKVTHSLGMAVMTRSIGPLYMLIKLEKSLGMFFWGTMVHILGKMFCPAFVFFWPYGRRSLCPTSDITSTYTQGNKYLTCEEFMGVTFSSYFVLILTTLLVIWIHIKHGKEESLVSRTSEEIPQHNHNISTFKRMISKLATTNSTGGPRQLSTFILLEYFLFSLAIFCICKLQRKYPIKRLSVAYMMAKC